MAFKITVQQLSLVNHTVAFCFIAHPDVLANYAAMLERSGCAYKFLREDILLDALSQLIGKEIEQAVFSQGLSPVSVSD